MPRDHMSDFLVRLPSCRRRPDRRSSRARRSTDCRRQSSVVRTARTCSTGRSPRFWCSSCRPVGNSPAWGPWLKNRPVGDVQLVQVLKAWEDLLQQFGPPLLVKTPVFYYVVEEFAPLRKLHYQKYEVYVLNDLPLSRTSNNWIIIEWRTFFKMLISLFTRMKSSLKLTYYSSAICLFSRIFIATFS